MSYRVQLQNFEGPLDLLLFLIKKEEVDIYDIPVAQITSQYLEYLQFIELLDLDNASEYVLMAATLIRIKAKMLLPKPELDDDDEAEDPREELVQRLLEYQKYKEVAAELGEFESEFRGHFPVQNFTVDLESNEDEEQEEEFGQEVTLFDLMSVFVNVIKQMPAQSEHVVERIPVTIEDQTNFILAYVESKKQVLFTELLTQIKERIVLIVTFVALLELVKNKRLRLNQSQPFAEIWLQKN